MNKHLLLESFAVELEKIAEAAENNLEVENKTPQDKLVGTGVALTSALRQGVRGHLKHERRKRLLRRVTPKFLRKGPPKTWLEKLDRVADKIEDVSSRTWDQAPSRRTRNAYESGAILSNILSRAGK